MQLERIRVLWLYGDDMDLPSRSTQVSIALTLWRRRWSEDVPGCQMAVGQRCRYETE